MKKISDEFNGVGVCVIKQFALIKLLLATKQNNYTNKCGRSSSLNRLYKPFTSQDFYQPFTTLHCSVINTHEINSSFLKQTSSNELLKFSCAGCLIFNSVDLFDFHTLHHFKAEGCIRNEVKKAISEGLRNPEGEKRKLTIDTVC
ncbi:CLUMA_CG018526, isoform A [Clunio marinus]|uniref:CLUMA_CG018526, isoform A n=1 Tax=Clunio marinus TaxID=568069 RepID=A0A1J1IZV8_9DIPT|nr:CLUMA_CG018526, isoform A [Clunio marinus]